MSPSLRNLVARRLVGDETDALNLALVVESDDSDKGFGVLFGALIELLQHLRRVCASKHGQLPHGPVPPIVVSWAIVVLTVHESVLSLEFQARNPAFANKVINFLAQLRL